MEHDFWSSLECPDIHTEAKFNEIQSESYSIWSIFADLQIIDFSKPQEAELVEETNFGNENTDGLSWQYYDNINEAMTMVFNDIAELMTGKPLDIQSEILDDFFIALSEKCTLIPSFLPEKTQGEIRSRIELCLAESGCLIAVVSDSDWRAITQNNESFYWDSGVRVVQITGMNQNEIIVNDPYDPDGWQKHIDIQDFSVIYGKLMEVYK